jgi:hypothetical protein
MLRSVGSASNDTGYVSNDTGYVSNDIGYVSNDNGYVSNDTGYVSNDAGYVSNGSENRPRIVADSLQNAVEGLREGENVHKCSVDFIRCIVSVHKDGDNFPDIQMVSDFFCVGGDFSSAGSDNLSAGMRRGAGTLDISSREKSGRTVGLTAEVVSFCQKKGIAGPKSGGKYLLLCSSILFLNEK